MGIVDYLVVNGILLSETRSGVESDYIADPLGSTAALMSTAGVITDTFTYWPYGQVRSHVGSSVTPYQFGGTLGYYADGSSGRIYVAARVYMPAVTRWLSVDPLWPFLFAYVYADSCPVVRADPSGTCPCDSTVTYSDHKDLYKHENGSGSINLQVNESVTGGLTVTLPGGSTVTVGAGLTAGQSVTCTVDFYLKTTTNWTKTCKCKCRYLPCNHGIESYLADCKTTSTVKRQRIKMIACPWPGGNYEFPDQY